MGFRYPVPNEVQLGRMLANGVTIPQGEFFVRYNDDVDGAFTLQNFKTGDEISYRPNVLKKNIKGGTNGNR